MPLTLHMTASRTVRAAFAAILSLCLAAALAVPAEAQRQQQRSVPIVRDAEIEALVREYAEPILRAAGLSRSGIEIILVNENSFNAFVDGRRIFINTGALMTAETPNEVIGVLAHEAGHIAGGHQERLRGQIARAQTMAIVASLLGLGAAVAGAATDSGGLAQSGMGIAMAGGEAARRSLLAYQRTEEATADRSAITYLERTGQSARGMLITFDRFQNALSLSGTRVDPYAVSHPMPRERIANMAELALASPHFDREDPPELQRRHDLMRAKIAAFTDGPQAAARLFRDDPRGAGALYGDAISTFLHGNPATALQKVDALAAAEPRNPYLQELRGEILLKANRPREAAEAFSRAIRLEPSPSGILQILHGRALLATGQADLLRQAAQELRMGLERDRSYVGGYRYLAQAYGQLGQVGEAELATAEGHYHSGNYRDAKIFAARAQQRLPQGSPGHIRAQDIINYVEPGRNRR